MPAVRRPSPPVLAAVSLLGGVGVGLAARASDHASAPLLTWAGTLGGPWLLAAFTVGAFARSRRRGALAGAAVLALGVVTYYAVFRLVEHRASTGYALAVGVAWAAGALPIGAAFGWAGGAWRRTRAPRWAAVLAGALVGEALLLWLQGRIAGGAWQRPDAVRALQIQALVGLAAAAVLSPARVRALAWTAAVALAAVAAEAAVRETLRASGWAGA